MNPRSPNQNAPNELSQGLQDPLNETRELLSLRAVDAARTVSAAFKSYSHVIFASEWAHYEDGETHEYVKLFDPMVRDLASSCLNATPDASSTAISRQVWNLINGVFRAVSLIPPTWPWRVNVIFDNAVFKRALNARIDETCSQMFNARGTCGHDTEPQDASTTISPSHIHETSRPIGTEVNDHDQAKERSKARMASVMPILEAKKWTRGKLACRAGVSKNSVNEYLTGKRSLSPDNRRAIAEVLGSKPEDLPN